MKKLLLVAALGVAGFMSANTSKIAELADENCLKSEVSYIGGFCEVFIYKGGKLVAYSYTWQESESACNAHATLLLIQTCKIIRGYKFISPS